MSIASADSPGSSLADEPIVRHDHVGSFIPLRKGGGTMQLVIEVVDTVEIVPT
jgi:hypothetical protein